MSQFLSLPREIRDNIIEHVLLPPNTASTTLEDLRTTHRDPICDSWSFMTRKQMPFHNFTNSTTPRATASGLLLSNTQLHSETQQALNRLWSKGMEYDLDVNVVQDTAFYFTWIRVPVKCLRIHRLTVTIKTVAVPEKQQGTYRIARSNGYNYLAPLISKLLDRLPSSGSTVPLLVENLDIQFLKVPTSVPILYNADAPPQLWRTGPGKQSQDIDSEEEFGRGPIQFGDYLQSWVGRTSITGRDLDELSNVKMITVKVGDKLALCVDLDRLLMTSG